VSVSFGCLAVPSAYEDPPVSLMQFYLLSYVDMDKSSLYSTSFIKSLYFSVSLFATFWRASVGLVVASPIAGGKRKERRYYGASVS